MTPSERRRIADKVRNRWYAARRREPEPEPIIQEVEPLPLEDQFDLYLTGIDKYILETLGVSV